ncbi:hypothetical protein DFH06DRAFT_1323593 [Mycena polygramma]|nr:hypothetical protein DFH06DRAFT_1323593 [Mycena polygramma]
MSAPTNTDNGPGESLQGWGSGINGANASATTNATGFPAPKGKEYAQNSTTAKAKTESADSAKAGETEATQTEASAEQQS